MRLLNFYPFRQSVSLNKAIAFGLFLLMSMPTIILAQDCNGGWISTIDGMEEVQTCPGDGIDDVIPFKIQHQRGKFRYLVTDTEGNILGIPEGNEVNFEGAGEGVCLVWGLGYQGEFIAELGDNIYTTNLCTGCFSLSENAVKVVRDGVDAGKIYAEGGLTEVYTCPGDGMDDIISFNYTDPGENDFQLVITDTDGKILGLPPGNEQNFEGAGEGICLVWGLVYSGELTAKAGDNALETPLADGCFDLTDEFVKVIRTEVSSGKVYAEGELLEVETCPGDGIDDVISFSYSESGNANTVLVVTDTEGKILGLPPANEVNFEGAGEGTCLVWSLNFTGDVLVEVGDNALSSELTSGCYALSDTFVTVTRGQFDAGMIYAEGELLTVNTCPSDGMDDIISFNYTDPGDKSFQLVITDADGNILGLPPGNEQNFEGAGEGVCLVWGMVYSGELTAQAGDNALTSSLSDGCFALSDTFVTIIRTEVLPGTVSTEDGELAVQTCPGDGEDDVIGFSYSESGNANTVLVVTDTEGKILGLPPANEVNFEGAGEGTCLVWSLNFTGDLLVEVGDNALSSELTSGCYALSDTFVTVTRGQFDAGMIYAEGELLTVNTCPSDGMDDIISFNYTDPGDKSFQLVITDADGNILGLPPGNEQNFEGAGEGVCLVWGMVYSGELTAQAGDNALTSSLSDGCFALSDTFVTIIRTEVLPGTVLTEDGELAVQTCPGDGEDDVISFSYSESGNANTVLVVTDTEGKILGLPPANEVNFEGAGEGTCLVWSLNFTGDLLVEVGDNALSSELTSGCYALSDTFVTVTRGQIDGGSVFAEGELLEVNTCPGDSIADVVRFIHSGTSDVNFNLIVTDTLGVILGIPPADSVDFEGAGEGICLVWGLHYTGDLLVELGDNALNSELTNGCYALSDTFVSIIRSQNNCPTNDNTPTSLTSIEREQLLIYPNPSNGLVRLNFSTRLNDDLNAHISIYDLRGQQIFAKNYQLNSFRQIGQLPMGNASNGPEFLSQQIEIDLRGLDKGVYILNMRHGDSLQSKRIVIGN